MKIAESLFSNQQNRQLRKVQREEQFEVRKLANALEKQGWTVWWDPKLRAGERFDDAKTG